MEIPAGERTYLRELARKQAEYAALPVMEQRKKMWYALNDGQAGARPPVVIETWTFDQDFLPESIFQCQSKDGRGIERQLLRHIRNRELLDDDKVIPAEFQTGWITSVDEYGISIKYERATDEQGGKLGYRALHPIKDLEADLRLLRPAVCRVDREATKARDEFLAELFDGILPVRLGSGAFAHCGLTYRVIALMGMQAYFEAMCDRPEAVHRLMAYLRDNVLRIMRWAEAEKLLRVNNGNQDVFGSSYNFTTRLPAPGAKPDAARLSDMWGSAESQETVAVSPRMFHEFCFPYYRDVCAPLGLLYYGCCEPVHPFWNDIKNLPHLKKVSISRWCDQRFMGEALRGTQIVYSRKPDPNFLGVDRVLDEERWAAHIRETLDATRGVFLEIIVRDVYTVHGNVKNARRAVEIAREQVEKYYRW